MSTASVTERIRTENFPDTSPELDKLARLFTVSWFLFELTRIKVMGLYWINKQFNSIDNSVKTFCFVFFSLDTFLGSICVLVDLSTMIENKRLQLPINYILIKYICYRKIVKSCHCIEYLQSLGILYNDRYSVQWRHSSESESRYGRSVSLGVEPHLGLMTRFYVLFDSFGFVKVGRPLWRGVGSVICHSLCPSIVNRQ
jgi:hypothetical protein